MIDRFFRKWTFRIAAGVLFVSASHADGISADKSNQLAVEVAEALSLAAGPKTELGVIHAEFGEFREKYILDVPAGIGKYIDHSSVISDSPKKVVIDYRFGNAASTELVGKHFQIIGEINAEVYISWSCHATDQIVIDHFPEQCLSQAEKEAIEAERIALELAALPRDEALRKQITEALSLAAGPKTELGIIHAQFGEFREKYIPGVPAGIGQYIDHSSVISDSPKKAVIDYRFGNAASTELVGKHFQIIGEIDAEDNISWSCHATDQIVIDHFPVQCLPEVEGSSDAATSQVQTTGDLLGLFFPDHKLRKQVSEALSLAAGPKTELGVIYAERGNFERRYEIYAGTGRYIDSSSVTYDDSGLKATITYRYGNEADPEIATQKLLIIGSIKEDMIHWSCQPADDSNLLNKHLPDNCQTEDQQRAAHIEAQEQANKIRVAELAALPREEALRRQVNEAMSTMAGIKTELSVIYAEHGDFGEKPLIDFVSGLYTEQGQVLYDDSGKQAIIEYQLGNEAWSEISGKKIQIIGNIAESSYGITWSCRAEADLVPYLPDDCQSE